MKLYYTPGACSMNPHIVLSEAGLKFDLEKVDLATHKTEKGTDYYSINPKGYVPALVLDDGQILTENPAIVQYIADQKPEAKLLPPTSSLERYRVLEWVGFISMEIHKVFGPLWNPKTSEEEKKAVHEKLGKRFEHVAKNIEGKQYLMGDQFTLPDAYMFVMLSWAAHQKVDLSKWPALKSYQERLAARPSIKSVLAAEFGKK